MIEYVACTKKGKGRKRNEDRTLIDNHLISGDSLYGKKSQSVVAVICDGIGEDNGGSIAAEYVASSFMKINAKETSPLSTLQHLNGLSKSISTANNFSEFPTMATTVAGVIIFKNQFLMFNIGDTRIYEYSEKDLIMHSKDHVDVDDNNALTQFIGKECPYCFPLIKRGKFEKTETSLLVCSDGLYKNVTELEIKKVMESRDNLNEKKEPYCKRLCIMAL